MRKEEEKKKNNPTLNQQSVTETRAPYEPLPGKVH